MLTDEFKRLPLAEIQIRRDQRQRREVDVADLLPSIRKRGVLQPIIVDQIEGEGTYLVAGERRLEASRQLGLPDIPVRFSRDLPILELQIIELEENLKRKDLPWKDNVLAVQRIHTLYCQLDPTWSAEQTAEALGLTAAPVSMALRVAREITAPHIEGASSIREAYNTILRRDQRAAGSQLEALIGSVAETVGAGLAKASPAPDDPQGEASPLDGSSSSSISELKLPASVSLPPLTTQPPVFSGILHGSFLEWAPRYIGPKFNLLHCDFPYGVNAFSGPQMSGGTVNRAAEYSDEREVFFTLLECLCENMERFASLSAHLMFWYSMKHDKEVKEIFRLKAPTWDFAAHPLVWGKSDNAGIVGDARRSFRHTYEVCLFASRGGRNLVQSKADFYHAPTDRTLHASAKPEPVLRHFMASLVDENTELLDPTCGSGSALRAAESLGAKRVLGLELDKEHFEVASQALRNHRLLASASKKPFGA